MTAGGLAGGSASDVVRRRTEQPSAMLGSRRAAARPRRMGIEWSVSAAMALERMRHDGRHLLSVLDGDLVIGRIHRRDLEDLSRCGAWLSSVLVRDAMRRAA